MRESTIGNEDAGSRALLADGFVLPEQIFRQPGFAECGSGRLMKAILEDAIACFFSQNRQLRSEAAFWIFTEETDRLFAFRGLCEALGIDAEALRAHLLASAQMRAVVAA